MNKVLEKAIDKLRDLSEVEQAEIASLLMTLTGEESDPVPLSAEERAAVQIGLDQAKRGEFVSDADMKAFWDRNKA